MSALTFPLPPETRVVVIPVAVDEYDAPPVNDPAKRVQLHALPRIRTDVALLRSLFESVNYRTAGFQMLETITGSAAEILARLSAISAALREHKQPLYVLLFWSGHGRAWVDQARFATKDSFDPIEPADGLPPNEVINKLRNTKVRALGLLCDVCQGGAAGASVVAVAARQMSQVPTFRGLSALFSAYPYENA